MAPFDLAASLGTVAYALVFGAIGFGFGAALEMGGFGDTRKLAGQFYLQDMTVLKVMFTAIVGGRGAGGAAPPSFGLLDMSRVFVNPTYLWPGIVGGLIMGVGFVVGGFCPGTSLVAASTLKIDGMLFLLGALIGVWLFGETVGELRGASGSPRTWGASRCRSWLGLPAGRDRAPRGGDGARALLGAATWPSRPSAQKKPWAEVRQGARARRPRLRGRAGRGEPGARRPRPAHAREPSSPAWAPRCGARWRSAPSSSTRPRWSALRKDIGVQVRDPRPPRRARLQPLPRRRLAPRRRSPELEAPERLKTLLDQPPDHRHLPGRERRGGRAHRLEAPQRPGRAATSTSIEGGMNRWLERYPVDACVAERVGRPTARDEPAWRFLYATGSSQPAAWPELEHLPVVPVALRRAGGRRGPRRRRTRRAPGPPTPTRSG